MDSLYVLVIENDGDVGALLEQHLRSWGCRVTVAHTGEGGLALAFGNPPPDLVIVDTRLPGIDGREVIRKLPVGSHSRQCRLISSVVLDQQHLIELAADALPAEPFRPSTATWFLYSFSGSFRQLAR